MDNYQIIAIIKGEKYALNKVGPPDRRVHASSCSPVHASSCSPIHVSSCNSMHVSS
jgi:hypothetical protein